MGNNSRNNSKKREGMTSNNPNISESGDESVSDEFAMDDAMDKPEFQPDDTPFSQFSDSEINHIGEYLEANNNMDRFWEEDLPDEPYFEGETIWDYALDISPHWTGNLHSYFGEGKENTRYGNGQVPGDLAMKVLVEEITGKTFTDASGQTAGY